MDLRRELNPQQYDAVTRTEGPVLVFAGAGSGKTRVITFRAAHIVADLGVAPWRVMCVTFTNKATGEMRARLAHLLGEQSGKALWVATFHATGAKLLRRYHDRVGLSRDFAIYDDADQRAVMNRVFDDLQIDEKALAPRAALDLVEKYKQECVTVAAAADLATTSMERRGAEIYANYERHLAAANAVDFNDLLKKLVELLERDEVVRRELQDRYRYVMVDEFQDTNAAQYRIVRALVGPERNLCVVGDDDQAIYAWRGADVRNIQYFKRDFPDARVIKLEENYRSTGRILRAANAVISRSAAREDKTLFTRNGEGALVELLVCRDEREEAARVASGIREAQRRGARLTDVAVFYRIHAQSRPLEEALRAAKVPYVIVGGTRFYERAEVKDLLAYLRLAQYPSDDVSLLRVINVPPRGIGKTTIDRVVAHARGRDTPLWKLIAAGDYPADVAPAARRRLAEFFAVITDLRRQAGALASSPADLAAAALDRTGYTEMLRADRSPEAEARLENLHELLGTMRAYAEETDEPTLADYLERVSLSETTPGDDAGAEGGGRGGDRVSLMTVHSAKGLEFDTVFVTGLEEQMFPYKGVTPGSDAQEMEEERRLAYVAITRARRRLVLSFATFRQIFGTTRVGGPSRFLKEIPADVLATQVPSLGMSSRGGFGASASFPSASSPSSARAAAAPGEVRIEYDDDAGGGEGHDGGAPVPAGSDTGHGFRRGMRVKHQKYGVGRVETVEPGAELKLTVFFPAHGKKKLLAEYVQPL